MNLTNIQEEYLKTIYTLQKKEKQVRVTDIANKLHKTKPTVNYAINNLKSEGLVNYEAYKNISLTNKGKQEAKKILEAYDIMYIFFNEILGLDEKKIRTRGNKSKSNFRRRNIK